MATFEQIVSRLDPVAQAQINPGGRYTTTTSSGTRVTATPTKTGSGNQVSIGSQTFTPTQAAPTPGVSAVPRFTPSEADLAAAGWTRQADGTLLHAGSGKIADASGSRLIGQVAGTGLPQNNTPSSGGGGGATTSTGGGGTGGGGTGGGGGGGQPTGGTQSTSTAQNSDPMQGLLGQLTAEEIEATIAYLESVTGLTREQLLSEAGQAGELMRRLMGRLDLETDMREQAVIGNALGRGIFRSGITQQDLGRVYADQALQAGDITGAFGKTVSDLQTQADVLNAQLQRKIADQVSGIENANIDVGLRAAFLNRLNELGLGQLAGLIEQAANAVPSADMAAAGGLPAQSQSNPAVAQPQSMRTGGFNDPYAQYRSKITPGLQGLFGSSERLVDPNNPLLQIAR